MLWVAGKLKSLLRPATNPTQSLRQTEHRARLFSLMVCKHFLFRTQPLGNGRRPVSLKLRNQTCLLHWAARLQPHALLIRFLNRRFVWPNPVLQDTSADTTNRTDDSKRRAEQPENESGVSLSLFLAYPRLYIQGYESRGTSPI